MESEVYFIEEKAKDASSRILAFNKLIESIKPVFELNKDEIVPIKVTIGDSVCIYQLDPQLVKAAVNLLKTSKAKPFLFDTNVIYKGYRMNAVDHLTLAQNKGFGFSKVGAPFIVADGLLGQDGREYAVNSAHISKIKIPSFVGLLDNLLVLSHVTGHILSGFAASIKNVAMGISCRATKQVQHSSLKPSVIKDKCTGCGCCVEICPVKAINFLDKKAFIVQDVCIGCGECLCACKFDAIYVNFNEDAAIFLKRMAEVANFTLGKFKHKFFINFAFDILQDCDCISDKNNPVICPDLGIFASKDILALDKATYDYVAGSSQSPFLDKNKKLISGMFDYAHKIGLGNLSYKLIKL